MIETLETTAHNVTDIVTNADLSASTDAAVIDSNEQTNSDADVVAASTDVVDSITKTTTTTKDDDDSQDNHESGKHENLLINNSEEIANDDKLDTSQVGIEATEEKDLPVVDTEKPIVSLNDASMETDVDTEKPIVSLNDASMEPVSVLESGSLEHSTSRNKVVDDDDDDDEDLFGDGDTDEGNEVNAAEEHGAVFVEMSDGVPNGTDVNHGVTETVVRVEESEPFEGTTSFETQMAPPYSPEAAGMNSASIPRKSGGGAGSPLSKKKPITYTKAALLALGLPDGVNVPYSVDKEKLLNNNPNNRKMMDTLRGLPVKLVNDALTEYDDAVQVKGNTIRNHGAYLYGVVKRYVAVHERAVAGGDGSGVLPIGNDLTPAVHTRLEQLVISGFCTREEMNDKVKSKIKMLPEKDALFALDELSSVSRSQIRNFGSYFMGILNRYMRGDENKNSGSNHYHHSSPQQKGMMSHQQRGRDRNSAYRDSNAPAYSYSSDRDRSRDRFKGSDMNDHRRAPPNPRDSSGMLNQNTNATDGRPIYDTRQQQQQQPSWQQNSSHTSVQQTNMMAYQNASRPAIRPPGVLDQQQPMMPGMASNNFPSLSQPPQNMTSYVYQQPSHQPATTNQYQQQQQQSNSANPFVVPGSLYAGQQSYQQQPSMVATGQTFNSSVGTVQQPYMQQPQYQLNMTNQPQQSQMSGFGRGTNQQQGLGVSMQQPTRVGGWQQQQPIGQSSNLLPVDILGLADKAASAVQALSSANQMQNRSTNATMLTQSFGQQQQPQQIFSTQSYQQPMYGNVGGGAVASTPYSVGGQMQATQSMQAQPPALSQHYSQAQPQSSSHSSYANNRTSGSQQQGFSTQDQSRRRTTASLNELPHGVQYAIQGLMASRAIEGPLDDGILGMIHDLPEALAIASLQKFAALDKSNMRNRTAYLAGVLRRELEKIQRR